MSKSYKIIEHSLNTGYGKPANNSLIIRNVSKSSLSKTSIIENKRISSYSVERTFDTPVT